MTFKIMVEWHNFIRSLYKCKINEWKRQYDSRASKFNVSWGLKIYYSDKIEPEEFEGYNAYPPNWAEFKKIMDDMAARIKERAGK